MNTATPSFKRKAPFELYIVSLVLILLISYFGSVVFLYDFDILNIKQTLEKGLSEHALMFWTIYNKQTPTCLSIGFVVWLLLIEYISYNFRNYQFDREHGEEDWADLDDYLKRRVNPDDRYNRYLSRNVKIDTQGEGRPSNNNMLIVATTGGYKTTSVLQENLLHAQNNFVFLDVKGELCFKNGLYLKSKGYDVKVLNLKDFSKSLRYNPFAYVHTEADIIKLITSIYDSLTPTKELSEDPLWIDGPKLFLQSLFYYEWWDSQYGKESPRTPTLNNVMKLLNEEMKVIDPGRPLMKGEKPLTQLKARMDKLTNDPRNLEGDNHPAVRDYRKFKEGATETVKSIVIIINAKLKLFETKDVARIFSGVDEMCLEDFVYGVGGWAIKNPDGTYKKHLTNKKTALFIVVDAENTDYHFIASILYDQLLNTAKTICDTVLASEGQTLPIPLEYWMDEFYKGAKMHDTLGTMGICRSYNISVIPILQSRAQLETLFPGSEFKILMDVCSVLWFGGAGRAADDTHKWISELLGQMTADKRSDSRNNNQISLSNDKVGVSLLTEQQVARIARKNAIMFIEEERPIFDPKRIPWEDKHFAKKGEEVPYEEAMKLNKKSKHGGFVTDVTVVTDEAGRQYTITGSKKGLLEEIPDGVEIPEERLISEDELVNMDLSNRKDDIKNIYQIMQEEYNVILAERMKRAGEFQYSSEA
ncbi:MAG: type IV secretory system conjugative DNA transfer family protein [Lachnospiraceae bacterium]|nr:type IV secretory system conjugative DNA transfer family protein [Lachnospiraceae bacterium]